MKTLKTANIIRKKVNVHSKGIKTSFCKKKKTTFKYFFTDIALSDR